MPHVLTVRSPSSIPRHRPPLPRYSVLPTNIFTRYPPWSSYFPHGSLQRQMARVLHGRPLGELEAEERRGRGAPSTVVRRRQLIAHPLQTLEHPGVPHHIRPKAGGGGDSSLPILSQNLPGPKSPGSYEQAALQIGARHMARSPGSAGSPFLGHPSEHWSEGISRSADQTSPARLEDVRPWTLRQWSQKSPWPTQPPSGVGHLRSTSPLGGMTPPGTDELIRAEQRQPDEHELADEACRRPPF